MGSVNLTMAVNGGDKLDELDLARLEELYNYYLKLEKPDGRKLHHFDSFKNKVEKALEDHVRRQDTFFVARPIHVQGAFYHDQDEFDHHITILPQRATWDAVNHGWDYLLNDRPEVTDPDFDSTIRHWAAGNLAKYLDIDSGFSRLETDQRDCFALILCLQKAQRYLSNCVRSEGVRFNVEVRENRRRNRDGGLYYIVHACKRGPF